MKPRIIGLLGVLALAWTAPALANGGVLVTEFDGPKKKAVRDRVVRALRDAGKDVEDASPRLASDDASQATRLAEKHDASAVVSGTIRMGKKGWKVTLTVRKAADGEVVDETEVRAPWLPGLLENIDKDVPASVVSALAQTESRSEEAEPAKVVLDEEPEESAAPPPDPDPVRDVAPAEDEPSQPKEKRPSFVDLTAAFRLFNRNLTWDQAATGTLRPYELRAAPAAYVSVTWYPAAHFSSGALSHLGVLADFEQSFGTSSELEVGGGSYDTDMQGFSAGARYRIPIAEHELGASVRYGRHAFRLDGDTEQDAPVVTGAPAERALVPDVAYQFVRAGLDARFVVSRVEVGLYAGYRHVLSVGDLATDAWFPAVSATAFDGGIHVGYGVSEELLAMMGMDVRRYALDTGSQPGELDGGRDAVGAAVDQYLTGWVGLAFRPGG